MEHDKDRLSIDAARLYYKSDYSQQQIADELGISRPTVSRLLQHAKEKGFVKIQIADPIEDIDDLESKLMVKYQLQDVGICYSPLNTTSEIKKYLGARAADYINDIVKDGDIIGVSWGTTMYSVACHLKPKAVKGAQIVQLKGGVSYSKGNIYADEIVERFAAAYSTIARYLPLPVIFESREIKEMVDRDRHMQRIVELGRQANIAVFTVGTVNSDALLFRLGYISTAEQSILQQQGVGDICSRFFDADGVICNHELDARTVGIKLEDLRNKEKSILVAGGARKIEAIKAALRGQFANVLITDQYTARELLQE